MSFNMELTDADLASVYGGAGQDNQPVNRFENEDDLKAKDESFAADKSNFFDSWPNANLGILYYKNPEKER